MTARVSRPATTASAPAGPRSPAQAMTRMLRHAVQPMIVLNIAAPFAAYEVLTGRGASELTALAVGSAFPVAGIVLAAVRSHRLEWIAVVSLATILVGLVAGVLFHNAQFLLVKDSILSGAVGLAFLASLAAPRPLLFVFGRQMAGGPDSAARDAYERQWTRAGFRDSCRRMTAVWGLALIAEASLRVALSFLISPATLMLISPLLAAAVFGPLAAWSLHRRSARLRAQRAVPTA